jgi:hypothetical protein
VAAVCFFFLFFYFFFIVRSLKIIKFGKHFICIICGLFLLLPCLHFLALGGCCSDRITEVNSDLYEDGCASIYFSTRLSAITTHRGYRYDNNISEDFKVLEGNVVAAELNMNSHTLEFSVEGKYTPHRIIRLPSSMYMGVYI